MKLKILIVLILVVAELSAFAESAPALSGPQEMSLPPEMKIPQESLPPPLPNTEISSPNQLNNSAPLPPPAATEVFGDADAFVYDPTDKRDPFELHGMLEKVSPADSKASVKTPEPVEAPVPDKPLRPLDPLENFELAQIRVQAIIWDTKAPRAMVEDPQGVSHTLRLKSRIGKHNGFVVAIRESEVVVVEYPNENGQMSKVFRILEMR